MMSMTNNWTYSELPENAKDNGLVKYNPLIQRLLLARGIKNEAEAEKFLEPNYERDLYDPFLLKGMAVAVGRIKQAIVGGEKVLVFGDYDADGVPASAILAEFFKGVGFENFSVYIPHRHKESYGLSKKAIDQFIKEKVDLIITVDCGVTAVGEVIYANQHNIDVIITDHHLAPAKLPPAFAIINPKQPGCLYPDKMLAGAGVAFKLVTALISTPGLSLGSEQEKWLLDLVAIATVSDMVPLLDENRALVFFGLKVLQKTRRPGLLFLFKLLGLQLRYISADDIGFSVGPRINSAGRLSHATEAYSLLTTSDLTEAKFLAEKLEKQNKDRRKFVEEILMSVENELTEDDLPPVVVCGSEDWSIGVLGLAAGRLAEKFGQTFFVWSQNDNGEIKGSCRSDGTINVVELMALANQDNLFTDFGGHTMAGGFSLSTKNLSKLKSSLNEAYAKTPKLNPQSELKVDGDLGLDDVNPDLYRQINKLSPFGVGNPKPIFLLADLIIDEVKGFGGEKIHLELKFKNNSGKLVKAIAFFACRGVRDDGSVVVHIFDDLVLSRGMKINMLAHLEESTFGFKKELRLRIVDLEVVA